MTNLTALDKAVREVTKGISVAELERLFGPYRPVTPKACLIVGRSMARYREIVAQADKP